MPENQYSLRSGEIQEIIGQLPPWTIQWGITVLFAVFMVLSFSSYFIQYPDVLPAKAIINSKEQPFRVSWYQNGPHVHKLYVKEKQMVHSGDTLIVEQSLVDGSITPIVSPVDGSIIMMKGTEDNPRKATIIVNPQISTFEVQLYLDTKGFGKIKTGQKVIIKLDAYPVEDFGLLEGKITSILPVSLNDKYRAEVSLLQGLVTTENKTIPAQHALSGGAEVLLDDRNLLSRVFGSLFRHR